MVRKIKKIARKENREKEKRKIQRKAHHIGLRYISFNIKKDTDLVHFAMTYRCKKPEILNLLNLASFYVMLCIH